MKTDSKRIIVLMVLTILASGCADTTTQEESSETFMDVNEFESIPNPVPSGQDMTLNMELENPGEADIDQVSARIFGPSYINELDTSTVNKDFGSLRASSDTSFPQRRTWTIPTQNLDNNREVDYNIYSKILYDYETRADTNFKIVSRERFREQGYSAGNPEIENSEAPIDIGIRGTTPITYTNEEINRQFCVTLENTADGTAFVDGEVGGSEIYEPDAGQKDRVELVIREISGLELELDESGDKENRARSGEEARVYVDLIEGNEGWQCFDLTGSLTDEERNINALFTAEYNYVEETETSVTVEGRRGSGDTDDEDGEGDFGDEPPENPGE